MLSLIILSGLFYQFNTKYRTLEGLSVMVGLELNFILMLVSFIFLITASWQDIRTRLVTDGIWVGMVGGGVLIHISQIVILILENKPIFSYISAWIINVLFAFTLALFLTFSGLGGEADRIAYIAIAIISPITYPFFIFPDPQYELILNFVPRILNVFFNAYLLTIPLPLLILIYNLIYQQRYPQYYNLSNESRWIRSIIRFIGYPHSTKFLEKEIKEKPWHYDFLEHYDEEIGWKFTLRARLDSPEADINRKQQIISSVRAEDKSIIWVQPSFPFVFILTIGYLLDLIFGNVLLIWMSQLL